MVYLSRITVIEYCVIERPDILRRRSLECQGQRDRPSLLGWCIGKCLGKRGGATDEREAGSGAGNAGDVHYAASTVMKALVPTDLASDLVMIVGG